MNRETTAIFIGHRDCTGLDSAKVEQVVCRLVSYGVSDFLCGGMGGFDWMCARAVYRCKSACPQLHSYLVIPYLTFRILHREYFDAVLYPEGFEKHHFKAAIPARNRYMVEHAAYALCYVEHTWGGAAQTYKMAVKKGLTVLNLGELPITPS